MITLDEPDVTLIKIYYPQHDPIKVHQSRVKHCPPDLPAGSFWYGSKRSGPGCPPKWTEEIDTRSHINAEELVQPGTDADNPEVQSDTARD